MTEENGSQRNSIIIESKYEGGDRAKQTSLCLQKHVIALRKKINPEFDSMLNLQSYENLSLFSPLYPFRP